jgi:hypothetical protein
VDGVVVRFDDLWARRETVELCPGVTLKLPTLADLVHTNASPHARVICRTSST